MPRDPAKSGRDDYQTPDRFAAFAVERALQLLPPLPLGHDIYFLEPGCGAKSPFAHAAFDSGCLTIAFEKEIESALDDSKLTSEMVRTGRFQRTLGIDYFDPENRVIRGAEDVGGWHVIATNPPYSIAEEFIRKSLSILHPWGVMCFLLRIQFVSSKKRMPLFRERPPVEVGVFIRRVGFISPSLPAEKQGGTDYTEYCLFYWLGDSLDAVYREHNGGKPATRFYWIDNSDPNEKVTAFGV